MPFSSRLEAWDYALLVAHIGVNRGPPSYFTREAYEKGSRVVFSFSQKEDKDKRFKCHTLYTLADKLCRKVY